MNTQKDAESLCKDFCSLNKGQKFKLLFETSTMNSRFKNGKPTEIGVYCENVKGYFITIPLKFEELKGRSLYQSSQFYECKNNGIEDSLFYAKYIFEFSKECNQIKTPSYYQYDNTKTDGNPYLGRFIEFALDEKSKVYYLEDSTTLKPYWQEKFKTLKKVDEQWYYECQ